MADLTKAEYAASLRSQAAMLIALANSIDDTPAPPERVLTTETGERIKVSQIPLTYLTLEPLPPLP